MAVVAVLFSSAAMLRILPPPLLLLISAVRTLPTNPPCTTECGPGQLCYGDTCKPCPARTYQTEPKHKYITCIPWTEKQSREHWVVEENGTAISDVKWKCEEGYKQIQFTVKGYECVPDNPTPHSRVITTTTPVNTPSTLSSVETPSPAYDSNEEEDGKPVGKIAGVVGGLVFTVFYIVIFIVLWRRRMLCFSESRYQMHYNVSDGTLSVTSNENHGGDGPSRNNIKQSANGHTPDRNGGVKAEEREENEPFLEKSSRADADYQFFKDIVKRLGPENTTKMLHYLPGFSAHVDDTVSAERAKCPHKPEEYLTQTCLVWARKTPETDIRDATRKALGDLGLLHRIPSEMLNRSEENGVSVVTAPSTESGQG